ncbi:hypothetical protein AO373_0923 [Moraxella catarrhalis]|nr:hypothetical protein AO379_1213 [Moraxella catarrhalis]OAV18339.1 hypothetical protein AO373_0923 [Moraxella catarrhalis]
MKQSCQWVKLTKLMANFYPLKSTKYWLNLLTVLTLLFMIGTILIGGILSQVDIFRYEG